jgi:hypothetical protein
MATQHPPSQSPKSTGPALFVILFGDLLDEAAIQLSQLLCTAAGELLKVLPSITLTACQALEACPLHHEWLFGRVQMLVSF